MTDDVAIQAEFLHDRTVNYAVQQNHVPVVKRLRLTNAGSTAFTDITVAIHATPGFAETWMARLAVLPAGQTVDLGRVDLRLSASFLAGLNERMAGDLALTVQREEEILFRCVSDIDVLAHDEWNGSEAISDIIAAFVTPNHPEVMRIVRRAADILGEWTGSPSITGYQTRDANQARGQLAALYTAIQQLDIAYCLPPPSFEARGQKIRSAGAIVESRLATCLDLAVLFASCAEAMGLYPIIVMLAGHAFAGAWLVDDTFADAVQDDVTLLTKRAAPGVAEMCVVECTVVTAGNNCPFTNAVALAEQTLQDRERFQYFVDIHRARIGQIRPLPAQFDTGDAPVSQITDAGAAIPQAPSIPVYSAGESDQQRPAGRLDQWRRRLLDLSLRNPLVNFKLTRSTIPLLCPDLGMLEDGVANQQAFQILPRPTDWEETPKDAGIFRARTHTSAEAELLHGEFEQNRLRAHMPAKELSDALTTLYRAARTSMEENGANTLFLALGLAVWYETPVSAQPRYAPLLLVPVEIVRKSIQAGYIVRGVEEDAQVNVALLEMLWQDHGIEVPGMMSLPRDEHGIDVLRVLTAFRHAIKHKQRWDVRDNAVIGIFSFNKFVMWNDLNARTADLQASPLVSSLMAGALQWQPGSDFPKAERLDTEYPPSEVFCPISADSSQLAAVCAAGKGKTFVLHGPPGTGKSQTITNIIAHALATGKSVLFVAEKMAALTVVQQRLARIGLDAFCLELHSNKSKKTEILKQLNRTMKLGVVAGPAEWQQEAARLAGLRSDLNSYVEALHRQRKIGHSVFEGLSRLAESRQAPACVKFSPQQVSELTAQQRMQWADLARQMQVSGEACGRLNDHPWADVARTEFMPGLRAQVTDALERLSTAVAGWRALTTEVAALFALPGETASYADLTAMEKLAGAFLCAPQASGSLVGVSGWEDTRTAIESWIAHGRTRDAIRTKISVQYAEQALRLDVASLEARLRQADASWFLPKWLGRRDVTRRMMAASKPGSSLHGADLYADLEEIGHLQREEQMLAAAGDRARGLLGTLWAEGNADWDAVAAASRWASEVRQVAASVAGSDLARCDVLREGWSRLLSEHREQLLPDMLLGNRLKAFCTAADAVREAAKSLQQMLSLSGDALVATLQEPRWFDYIHTKLQRWQNSLDELRDWSTWVRVRAEAQQAGLSPVVTEYERGALSHAQVEPALWRGVYETWCEGEIGADPVLRQFSRGLFEDKIESFCALDERFADLSRREIYARLAAQVPHVSGEAAQSSEVGILQRQILRQRGHMAVRELIAQIPHLLRRLKPCMLMSPMSVAQYLDPSQPPFDLVIFDEASQVPTCDAVGALGRGATAVIVGDPKQLPPTSFFAKTNDGDGDDAGAAIEDLESILDDCLALSMPQEHLRWHYRSRHESLIAFSNYNYYDNSLLTFPSSEELTPAVLWHPVKGMYDRGKSRKNQVEAEAIITEVVRRLSDARLCRQSIGIISFNQAQQRLIEDLLDEQMSSHPELEPLFTNGPDAEHKPEPVFVKNLENVQGDERDVILFSVGFGPDERGTVSMNFGPLNQEGGHRRLNVAVSRAREEMVVFSSMRADQLDLSRTRARGVADLRAFLEYAERGRQALLGQPGLAGQADWESPFEEQVCKRLRERGHTVHTQVGCSGYRIDLAVVDPARPGRYVLGIECDGAAYHRAKTARDRDKLRGQILKGLGWSLHRVWSTDWWDNPAREVERIESALEAASLRAEETPSRDVASPASQQPDEPVRQGAGASPSAGDTMSGTLACAPQKARSSNAQPYTVCRLSRSLHLDNFYEPDSTPQLVKQVTEVVKMEGPITFRLLCRRVMEAWGMSKVGSRIDQRLRDVCAQTRLTSTASGSAKVYWPGSLTPHTWRGYRSPAADPASERKPEDLPYEEIANAAYDVLSAQIGLAEADLVRETGRLFGYQRTGQNVDASMQAGIALLVSQGRAKREAGERIVVVG